MRWEGWFWDCVQLTALKKRRRKLYPGRQSNNPSTSPLLCCSGSAVSSYKPVYELHLLAVNQYLPFLGVCCKNATLISLSDVWHSSGSNFTITSLIFVCVTVCVFLFCMHTFLTNHPSKVSFWKVQKVVNQFGIGRGENKWRGHGQYGFMASFGYPNPLIVFIRIP